MVTEENNPVTEEEENNPVTEEDKLVENFPTAVRKSYELKEKRFVVQQIDALISVGHSRRNACQILGIPTLYYRRWKQLISKVFDVNSTNEFVSYNTKGTARKIHPGRPSALSVIRPQMKEFVSSIRERGIQLTNRMMGREASRILPSFKDKTVRAKAVAIHRFTRSLGLVQRTATHTAQKHFTETTDESKDFISMIRVKVQGRDPDDILNMDQTPIPYSYHSNKTLEAIGSKTVQQRSSTSGTKRITLAATVTASGKMLPPFLIFKGTRNGRISREFVTFPAEGKYACQPKAWMDEGMMNAWIEVILKPWKDHRDANNPSIQPPILVLDAYNVHQMGSVVNRIQSMGIEVVHIPAGCTYLCQPIDVGINKPIKTRVRERWEDWMMDGGGVEDGVAKEPSRKMVAEWVVETYTAMPETIGRNAWMKTGFEWF